MEVDTPPQRKVELIRCPGGITTVGHQMHSTDPSANIATVLAANSGRPGGACRAADGRLERSTIHGGHSTQEEDVVSNWLLACGSTWQERERLFELVSFEWGLADPAGTSTRTLQGVDYTRVFPSIEARMYADAWALPSQALCRKEGTRFDTNHKYPTTLVFVAGPNANPPRSHPPNSSMRRTFCAKAHDAREFFEAGTAWAIYAALCAAKDSECNVVLLPFVSGGLYAGPWRGAKGRLDAYVENINRMLGVHDGHEVKGVMPDNTEVPPLGRFFSQVAVVVL